MTNATSTFAASTCSRVTRNASLRESWVRRGSTASTSSDSGSRPTQSPTAGSASSRASRAAALARELTGLTGEIEGPPVLNGDAGGDEPCGTMLGERDLPAVVPAEALER